MRGLAGLALLALIATPGCETHDIGQECPGLEVPLESGASTEGDVMRAQGSEVVQFDTTFPCQDAICVATWGRGSYCSRECTEDEDCPDGFTCRQIVTMGPFAEQKFCAWAECATADDCGQGGDFDCEIVEEESLGSTTYRCDWAE